MDTLFDDRKDQRLLFEDLDETPLPRAIPLTRQDHQPLAAGPSATDQEPPAARMSAIGNLAAPPIRAGERFIKVAYRLGLSGSTISAPFRKPAMPRLLATVESPLAGERATGVALRAGYFLIHGTRTPIGQMEFASTTRLTPPFERVVHGFSWLRDLAGSGAREQCADTAECICRLWLEANPLPAKGAAWQVGHAAHRLLAWLVHAPLLLSGRDDPWRRRMLAAIEATARWLDRHVAKSEDGSAALAGWAAITAAGLLMPHGRPRRIYGEAGLIHALSEVVGADGGVLSRSPLAQIEAIALLIDLLACYRATRREPPRALGVMLELLVPPLLALRHGDGGLGSWHGSGAVSGERLAALIDASGVRARPLQAVGSWGFQRLGSGKTAVQFDAAPPPGPRFARFGCASTLAFEMSVGPHRLIVNCGGAALAGGMVPCRIEQGLRASAAHSTLVLDNANSTAVLLGGKLGKGVEEVELDLRRVKSLGAETLCVEASHDGYLARFGLTHRRILMLRADGLELRGEDLLMPERANGKRGKIGFAIRFHLGPGVGAELSQDRCGAALLLPDGSYWQLRIGGGESGCHAMIEDSIWVDGDGRPRAIQQVVVEAMTSRSGGQFSWLLRKMG